MAVTDNKMLLELLLLMDPSLEKGTAAIALETLIKKLQTLKGFPPLHITGFKKVEQDASGSLRVLVQVENKTRSIRTELEMIANLKTRGVYSIPPTALSPEQFQGGKWWQPTPDTFKKTHYEGKTKYIKGKEGEPYDRIEIPPRDVYKKIGELSSKQLLYADALGKVKMQSSDYAKGPKMKVPPKFEPEVVKATKAMHSLDKAHDSVIKKNIMLAARAIAVIPIWMAMRFAYTEVIKVFSLGLQTWREMDKAMLKAEAVIHNTTMSIGDASDRLRVKINTLASETGVSMQQLASVFYRFGTVGIDFEASQGGMVAATKAAVAMMGNADDIAKVLARTYLLLGDTMDANLAPAEKMEVMAAKLYVLWQKNAFEINGMNESLMKFLPVADTYNFTIDETFALLSALNSASLVNGRAGRLMATALLKQVDNYGKIGDVLGLDVNPAMETQFEITMRILDAINKLKKAGDTLNTVEINEALSEIFGGTRSQQPIQALASVYDLVNENLKEMGTSADEVLGRLNERVENVNDGLDAQINKLKETQKLYYESFLQALFGGDSFAETLGNINNHLKDMIGYTQVLVAWFEQAIELGGLITALADLVSPGVSEEPQLFRKFQPKQLSLLDQLGFWMRTGKTAQESEDELKMLEEKNLKQAELAKKALAVAQQQEALQKKLDDEKTARAEKELKIRKDTAEKIRDLEEGVSFVQRESQGTSNIELKYTTLNRLIEQRVAHINSLKKAEGDLSKSVEKEVVLGMARNKQWAELEKILKFSKDDAKDLLEITKASLDIDKEKIVVTANLKESLLAFTLSQATAAGALTSENLKLESIMRKRLSIEDDEIIKYKKQLDLIQAQTEEKKLQNRIGNDSLKLFDIAEKYGTPTARIMGELLSGQRDLEGFLRQYKGKQERKVFEENFEDKVKQLRAEQFLKGERVLDRPGMSRGKTIPINEEAIRGQKIRENFKLRIPREEWNKQEIQQANLEQEMKKVVDKISPEVKNMEIQAQVVNLAGFEPPEWLSTILRVGRDFGADTGFNKEKLDEYMKSSNTLSYTIGDFMANKVNSMIDNIFFKNPGNINSFKFTPKGTSQSNNEINIDIQVNGAEKPNEELAREIGAIVRKEVVYGLQTEGEPENVAMNVGLNGIDERNSR